MSFNLFTIKKKNMNLFLNLGVKQKKALLKLPAYVALLASTDIKIDDTERMSAIKLAHTMSFSCEPLLAEFYQAADINFENNINQLDKDLPKEKGKRDAEIKRNLLILDRIVLKLGKGYTIAMHRSLKKFKKHVAHAHHSVIEDFLLPIPISGLTD